MKTYNAIIIYSNGEVNQIKIKANNISEADIIRQKIHSNMSKLGVNFENSMYYEIRNDYPNFTVQSNSNGIITQIN